MKNQLEDIKRKLHIKEIPKPVLIVLVLIAIGIIIFALLHWWPSQSDSDFVVETNSATKEAEDNNAKEETNGQVAVYVSGAVKNPGVYYLEEGSRIIDAVGKAGGMCKDANTNAINLAEVIQDGTQIYIPTIDESSNSSASTTTSSGSVSGSTSLVNINSADATELQTLPGIGEVTAQKIISDRESNGAFSSKEDLKRVSGIGDSKYAALEDLICI